MMEEVSQKRSDDDEEFSQKGRLDDGRIQSERKIG
jgi:hypothetical protein